MRANQLEKNVAAQDREIAALTSELQSLTSVKAPPKAATSDALREPPAPCAGQDFVQLGLESLVQRLKQLLAAHDLTKADPSSGAPCLLAVPSVLL
jgi:hypothetical protein